MMSPRTGSAGAALLSAAFLLLSCRPEAARKPVLYVWTTESDPATLSVMSDIGNQLLGADDTISRVDIQSVKWSELSTKLQQAFQGGRLPGLTHLEPFFTKTFVDRDLLVPMDDLVRELGEANIHDAVRRVARFNGHYYGIPQHFGVSFMAYRRDLMQKSGVVPPTTWPEMLDAAPKLNRPTGSPNQFAFYFPGGDRFFVDAIFFEALASNGGRAYTDDGLPDLQNQRIVETLDYLAKIVAFAPEGDWQGATYVDGFPWMVRGSVVVNLFAGGRGTKTFDEQWTHDANHLPANQVFLPMEPPVGPRGTKGYSSVDCEPFVIIRQSQNRGINDKEAAAIEAAAANYLRLLYRKDNYLRLMESVPIQLMPIFRSLQREYSNNVAVQRWRPWYDQALRMIESKQVNAYFTTREDDLQSSYLFSLYGEKVITNMVTSVLSGKVSSTDASRIAQDKALVIIKQLQ